MNTLKIDWDCCSNPDWNIKHGFFDWIICQNCGARKEMRDNMHKLFQLNYELQTSKLYKIVINTSISEDWNQNLIKSNYANFFQTTKYLESLSNTTSNFSIVILSILLVVKI